MSGEPFDARRLAPRALPGVRILPVVHERIEIAAVVRAALDQLDPAAVAVELPATLEEAVGRALDRLPRVSLVITEEPGEEALVWTVAPGEPFVEALRWARERGRRAFFVDPDLPYPARHADPVPDPYALLDLGAERYLELVVDRATAGAAGAEDRRREEGLAYHLDRAVRELEGGELVALVGAAHARRVAELLAKPQAHPFARRRRARVDVRHLEPASLTALLPDPPLAHAVWERLRGGDTPEAPELTATISRRVSVVRLGWTVITGEKGEGERRRRHRLVDFAAARAAAPLGGTRVPDRRRLGKVVWRVAAACYAEQTGETPRPWQGRRFFDFANRLARVQGQLVAGLYEWVVAGRGVGDDNLAWEICEAARAYPWQEGPAEIETASVDGLELDLGTRKLTFRRRFLRVKRRPVRVPVRERPRPDDPERWFEAFDSEGICSFPPEDVRIEDYGRYLQGRALSLLSAERSRSEPFTSGMLDGLDLRETMRNFHTGQLYVREEGRAPGEAGAVVVLFDRDPDDERYPFRMTWLGEHDQESDMAFYSTDPGAQVVGPGILRATYGGFLLTQPRGRLADVWSDPDYRFARDKAEILVTAAIDYSLEATVVHVAADPPPERLKRYAAMQRKRLYHLPLGSLGPESLKKIRVVHLLSGHDRREVARDYVW